jgi:hypothetical protein
VHGLRRGHVAFVNCSTRLASLGISGLFAVFRACTKIFHSSKRNAYCFFINKKQILSYDSWSTKDSHAPVITRCSVFRIEYMA